METLLLILHYAVCVFLVIAILLQAGKGTDMSAVFGGGSGTVFGSRGAATFLSKVTTGLALIFLVTSITLANMSRNRMGSSILKSVPAAASPAPTLAPVAPESQPQPPESQPSVVPSAPTPPTPETLPK